MRRDSARSLQDPRLHRSESGPRSRSTSSGPGPTGCPSVLGCGAVLTSRSRVTGLRWTISFLTTAAVTFGLVGLGSAEAGQLAPVLVRRSTGVRRLRLPGRKHLESLRQPRARPPSSRAMPATGAGALRLLPARKVATGNMGSGSTAAPPQISLAGAFTPANALLVNPRAYTNGYSFRYLYPSGSSAITADSNCCGGMDYGSQINKSFSGQWFEIRATCRLRRLHYAEQHRPSQRLRHRYLRHRHHATNHRRDRRHQPLQRHHRLGTWCLAHAVPVIGR